MDVRYATPYYRNRKSPWNNTENNYFFSQFPHYLIPEQNLYDSVSFDCEKNNLYREPFPYSSTYHLPFLPPNKMCGKKFHEGDPITSLVSKKLQWQDQMDLVEKKYKNKKLDFESVGQEISPTLSRIQLDRNEAFILHMLNLDPDPNFTGVTNWWYSGGRVSHMLIGGQMALLTSSGKNNEKLYVVPISDHSKSWQPIISDGMEFPTSTNEPIYQIVSASKKSGRHNLVGLRKRNACTILSLQLTSNSFEHREDKCWEVTYEEAPFTSLDFNPYKFSTFCTSSVERQVSLWDSKKCCCISTQFVPKPDENLSSLWCSLQYLDANTIVMSDPSTLMLLDTRQAFDKPSLVYCPHHQPGVLKSCEDISLTFRSSNPSSSGRHFYCGTTHRAFMFDVRGPRAVQVWTHMMRSPPLYGHSVSMGPTDTKELVCIANQKAGDMQLIVNDWCKPDERPRSATLPYSVPSMITSLNSAQMSGKLLDPRTHCRLKFSISGVTCLPVDGTTAHSIVTQTSAGDVFVQELRDAGEEPTYTETDMLKFQNWEEQVLKTIHPKKLNLSSQCQNKMVVEAISNSELKVPRYKKKIRLPEFLKSSNIELFSYKDVLAAKLLEAWDIDPPETDGHNSSKDILPCNDISHIEERPSKSNTVEIDSFSPNGSSLEGIENNSVKKKGKRIADDMEQEENVVTESQKKKKRLAEVSRVSGF